MNKRDNFYIFIAVCLVAFGWFLNDNFTSKEIKIEYGDIKVVQIKSSYKPLAPVFYFENNTVLVQKVVRDSNTYLSIKDSVERFSDSLNVKIVHTTIIDPDSVHARTFWEESYQIFKRVDSIFVEKTRLVTEEVPLPFYKNHWFFFALAEFALLIMSLFP